ncbi:MAG: hypothetical protein ACI87O_002632, partial [Planctomycetota bacterium]
KLHDHPGFSTPSSSYSTRNPEAPNMAAVFCRIRIGLYVAATLLPR